MTDEEKRFWVAVATAVFDTLMLVSGATFLAEYREAVLLAAGVVSILASAFLGVQLRESARAARAERLKK